MHVIINPGSEPVEGATEDQANANMAALCAKVNIRETLGALRGGIIRLAARDRDGRYGYLVYAIYPGAGRCVEVDMPGCDLARIAFASVDGPDSLPDGLFTPRVYVDSSSWLWPIAVGVLTDHLRLRAEDEDE